LASGSKIFVSRNESNHLSTDTSPSDISSFVDDFVETWKKENPHLGSPELNKILASANTVKAALLNPYSK
jgi:hypothetical protein